MRIVVEGLVTTAVSDSDKFQQAEIAGNTGFTVMLQSFSTVQEHPIMERLKGRTVRVTVEDVK